MDEDLSDCGTDYNLDYELRMVTNMTTEIQTQLSLAADIEITQALNNYLAGVFTDNAKDVDLGFYDVVRDPVVGDSLRLYQQSHIMNANQSSYTLYIPIRQYMHLAVANIVDNGLVSLEDGEWCHASRLAQPDLDTIPPHRTGLFTARLEMDIKEVDEDQEFNVSLYMANCASSLIIDTLGSGVRDFKVYASGFATAFRICDSTFVFRQSPGKDPVVVADEVELEEETGSVCFACINFPSRDPMREEPPEDSKTIIETEDPFISERADEAIWTYTVYATLPDGSVTQSVLGVFKPLRAGQFKIIRARVQGGMGGVVPKDNTVGASIRTDWHPGMETEVPLGD